MQPDVSYNHVVYVEQVEQGGIVKCCGWQESASQRFQAASFISPSMNGTPSMTWVMSL